MELVHARINEKSKSSDIYFDELNIITKFNKAEFCLAKKSSYDDNDFYIEIGMNNFKKYDIQKGDFIYIPDSEFGGKIECIDHSSDDSIKISGCTWRYLLHKQVIFPKFNSTYQKRDDYLVIKNLEANKAINELMKNTFYSEYLKLFRVSDISSDVLLSFQARYEYLYDKIVSVLSDNDMRLKVEHSYEFDTQNIVISAVNRNHIDDVLNRDYQMSIYSKNDYSSSVDTILALGQGELHERDVVLIQHSVKNGKDIFESKDDLKNDEIGSLDSSIYIYDYSSCENKEDLIEKAIEEFKNNYLEKKEVSISLSNVKKEFDLGDVITGIDELTGIEVEAEITQKTLTIQDGKIEYSYKVGD